MLGPARFITSGSSVSSNTRSQSGNYEFVDTLLKPNCTLIVKLTQLKQRCPVQIVLTVKDARRVYACSSLKHLCETTYSRLMESDVPEAGEELAVRISPSGVVFISHNNRGWSERLRVDTDFGYHVVFDKEHIAVLTMIGMTTADSEVLKKPGTDHADPPPHPDNSALPNCIACLVNAKDVAVIPCFHVALCRKCAQSLLKSDKPECPVCQKTLTDIQELHFA